MRRSRTVRNSRFAGALALLASASLLTACSGFLGSASPRPVLNAVIADSPREIDVVGGAEFIRFEGNITTSSRCQEIRARLDRFSESDGVIDIAVVARELEGCPNQEETTWNYVGNLQGITPGEYAVTVEHRFPESDRSSQVVFDGRLTVSTP